MKKKKLNGLFLTNKKSFEAEKIRSIQVSLEFALITQKKKKILMFTSANKGEGKTLCISKIAQEAARQGKRVLLIDLDLHRPRLSKSLCGQNTKGLMNILREDGDLNDYVLSLNEDNLYLLPTGPLPPNPLEVISSDTLKELIAAISEDFDYVFIDTPPVRILSDSRVVATLCDGVIFVVKNGETKMQELKEAKEAISKTGTPIIGAILNGYTYNKKAKSSYVYY
ncbi:putative capsular polysaccharide biosynthesis protein [Listeria fleischmannii 1991]|uniref:non-specific protein-tyrosine kinase n=3 Tax=Listeria fleischmannii TaxID=1069827 RepID=A0A2X3H7B4_9LIST|nr:CpsD/CapB family tyrosine-protein kinase [Listeria fleischmannii]KMT60361.1 putative capsular polysaccharide biosynthesis protein [Listeria fleischmannii 1991]SQC70436.1 Tyrosine-protein kinase YwqD [Listeria fleischmannii subsp. fleischmannii]